MEQYDYNELEEMIEKEAEINNVSIAVERPTIDKHKNATQDMLLDTEAYRINKIYNLLKGLSKDTTKQQAIRYLLSYSDMLDKEMAAEIIEIANGMLVDSEVRDSVKIKVATDLKAFLGNAGKSKKVRTTFEELRGEDGFLEVEVPD